MYMLKEKFRFLSYFFINLKDVSGFASHPHFLHANEKFLNPIIGLKPNESIHKSVIHYEPVSDTSCFVLIQYN